MTPSQQKKYYAENKAEAAKKEKEKDYEVFGSRGDAARKGMEEGRMDAMGTAYRKGGYVKAADGIVKRGKTRGKIC